jgi:hypothetical protein
VRRQGCAASTDRRGEDKRGRRKGPRGEQTSLSAAIPLPAAPWRAQVTFEAPPGLKQNLTRTLASWSPEALARGGPLRAQLSFLLAWLHALLQERRSYVPVAWSKAYEISAADLRAGEDLVARAAAAVAAGPGSGVPWRRLAGLLVNAVYGGRVDDPYDSRVSGGIGMLFLACCLRRCDAYEASDEAFCRAAHVNSRGHPPQP